MKKIIITTTILDPTTAIHQYDQMKGWELIVTGDRKSPEKYELQYGTFLDWKYQQKNYPELCKLIGPDSTARGRMIGIIEAYKRGADVIATIDDDNYPYRDWGRDVMIGQKVTVPYCHDGICFDPLREQFPSLWHRGFPLELLSKRQRGEVVFREIVPLIQADLWDGDPDVDATIRITRAPNVLFKHTVPFAGGKFSPMNSQNTFISGKHAMDWCPFAFIGRAEDIWGGYVFQALHPSSAVYGLATVEHRQQRSMGSLVRDLRDEIFCYENTLSLVTDLATSDDDVELVLKNRLPLKAYQAWQLYREQFK